MNIENIFVIDYEAYCPICVVKVNVGRETCYKPGQFN